MAFTGSASWAIAVAGALSKRRAFLFADSRESSRFAGRFCIASPKDYGGWASCPSSSLAGLQPLPRLLRLRLSPQQLLSLSAQL